MKPGLIFDLDGTLVDSLQGISASLNHALSRSGLQVHEVSSVRRFIGNGARILIQRGAPADTNPVLLSTLENAFKVNYDLTWPEGTLVYEGILALLEHLQNAGYPLAVLSNKPHAFTQTIVSRIFPNIRFQIVLGQRDGISHKPDPSGALEIAREFGLSTSDCIVIGDSTIDIETARNAGMRSIAVTWGFHDREPLLAAGADGVAANPEELGELIQST